MGLQKRVSEGRVGSAYGLALILVVASVVIAIASAGARYGTVSASLFQGVTLIVILQVSETSRRWLIAFTTGAIGAMAIAAGLSVAGQSQNIAVPVAWVAMLLGTMIAIARHLRSYRSVTIQMVLGLLTTYLLIGLLFAHVFMLVETALGTFFVGGQRGLAAFVYFSYVTLATVGYGDLVAAEGWPRALAVAEAVFGQLYLVSVVALAVGRFGRERDIPKD